VIHSLKVAGDSVKVAGESDKVGGDSHPHTRSWYARSRHFDLSRYCSASFSPLVLEACSQLIVN